MQGFKFEKAMKILIEYFPEEKQKKPTLFHCVRVWAYLWNHNYSEEVQIAGLLHDALEDTPMSEAVISEYFWSHVLEIVKANSENMKLDKSERLENIVMRCAQYSEDALIVKMADVYDNFSFYKKTENIPEIERCKKLSRFIQKYKKEEYRDIIFKLSDEILEY